MKSIVKIYPIFLLLLLMGCAATYPPATQDAVSEYIYSQTYPYDTEGTWKAKACYKYSLGKGSVYVDMFFPASKINRARFLKRNIFLRNNDTLVIESSYKRRNHCISLVTRASTQDTLVSYIQKGKNAHSIRLKGQEDVFMMTRAYSWNKWAIVMDDDIVGCWTINDSSILLELNHQPSLTTLESWKIFTATFATEQIMAVEKKANGSGWGLLGILLERLLCW